MNLATSSGSDWIWVLFAIFFFGGFAWLFDLTDAIAERLRKGGGTPRSMKKELTNLRQRNLELENLLLKIQLWEHNSLIQLPSEIGNAVDQALLPKPKKGK